MTKCTLILSLCITLISSASVFAEDDQSSTYLSIKLPDIISWFSQHPQPVFISRCHAIDDAYIDDGLYAILIAQRDLEMLYLLDVSGEYTFIGGVDYDERTGVGFFEVQGGIWSHIFGSEIYAHLNSLPFFRVSDISAEALSAAPGIPQCKIDHSSLMAYPNAPIAVDR